MPNIGTDVNQIKINSLNHIQGQPDVVNLLKVSLESYFNSRASAKPDNMPSFGPVLLVGPSGTGKSLVSQALHSELANLNLIESNGESVSSVGEMAAILLSATNDTTIFLDEAQSINNKVQNILLTAISERKLFLPRGGSRKSSFSVPLANFCLILASTHEYQLQDALRNRMRIYCRFNYYSIDDLTNIVKQRADSLGWKYENEEVLRTIALRAKQTPRLALNRNLQMAYNVSTSHDREMITLSDVEEAFKLLKIDELGLDTLERQYLRTLLNGSTKLNVIASKTGLPSATLQNVVEPFLIRENLIDKQGCTRILTEKGKQHILHTEY
ncbi:MAG: Holliday junction DNA helicase RuvB C-terminal domain-containing protein [Sedimentisphaerales bacterium]